MKVEVRLFAVARHLAGQDSISVELADGATVAQLREALGRQVPQMSPSLEKMTFAVNARYAADSCPIPPGAEIACIPPVSGG